MTSGRPLLYLCSVLLGAGWVLPTQAEPERDEVITLEEAYDRALGTDQSIRIAYLELRKARLLPWSALARLGPRLSADGGYNRSERALTTPFTETILDAAGLPIDTRTFDRTSHSHSGSAGAGISYQQPLIDLTVFPAYRLGKLSEAATRLQHRFTIRGTLFGVTQAYYEVLQQQRLVEVNRETLRLSKGQLEIAQSRANAGEVTRSDVLRAEVTFQTARRTLIESSNTLASKRNLLGNVLNLPPDAPFRVAEPPDYPTLLPPFPELLVRAHRHREDLRAQDLAIRQDEERRNGVLASYGPSVSAGWNGDLNNNTGTSNSKQRSWQAAVTVSVPIFTGGQREIDLANAGTQIEQTRLGRDSLAKTIEQEVKDAWLAARTLDETIKAVRAQVVAAEQGYIDLQNQYRAGAATSVDVLSALTDLNTARKDLAVQTYTYQVALRNLEQVSGVFQEPRVQQAKIR